MPKQPKSKTADKSEENLTILLESDDTFDEMQQYSRSLITISIIPEEQWGELTRRIADLDEAPSPLTKSSPIFSRIHSSPPAYDPDASQVAMHAENLEKGLGKLEKTFTTGNFSGIDNDIAHMNNLLRAIKSSKDRRDTKLRVVIKQVEDIFDSFLTHPTFIQMKREAEMSKLLLETREKMLYEKMFYDLTHAIQNAKDSLNQESNAFLANKTKKPSNHGWFNKHSKIAPSPAQNNLNTALHQTFLNIHELLNVLQTRITDASQDSKSLLEKAVLSTHFIQHEIDKLRDNNEAQHFIPLLTRLKHNVTHSTAMFVESYQQIKKLVAKIVTETSQAEINGFERKKLGKHIKNLLVLNEYCDKHTVRAPHFDAASVELFENIVASKSKLTAREIRKFKHYDIRNKTAFELLTRMLPDDQYAQFKLRVESSIAALNARLLETHSVNNERASAPKKAWGP